MENMFTKPLGARAIVQALVEDLLNRFVAPGQGIADDDLIAIIRQVFGSIALTQLNTLVGKLGAHGRINILIRATDLMSPGPGQQRQTTHESPADSQQMELHAAPPT